MYYFSFLKTGLYILDYNRLKTLSTKQFTKLKRKFNKDKYI